MSNCSQGVVTEWSRGRQGAIRIIRVESWGKQGIVRGPVTGHKHCLLSKTLTLTKKTPTKSMSAGTDHLVKTLTNPENDPRVISDQSGH